MDATRFEYLLNRYVDESLLAAESRELEQWLLDSPEARELFWKHIRLHGLVRDYYETKPIQECIETAGASVAFAPQISTSFDRPSSARLGSVGYIHATYNYFSSGWPAAYLIAAIICGIGLTIAAFTHVSQPTDIAQHSNDSNPQSLIPNLSPQTTFVARITGQVDCRWSDAATAALDGSYVPLGRKYALASGLMEITYKNGAKVLLQGPCVYEVDSIDGGYLSIGKLTARVEERGERRGEREGTRFKVQGSRQENHQIFKSPNSNPEIPKSLNPSSVASSQWLVARDGMQNAKCKLQNAKLGVASESSLTTNHYPLFTIKTPTATITDLGTEFGVEVDGRGGTRSHVFQGLVEVRVAANEGRPGKTLRLGENQSVCITKDSQGETVEVSDGLVDPTTFVRNEQFPKMLQEERLKPLRRWQAYNEQLHKDPALVAHYTFEAADPGDIRRLPNLSLSGRSLDGRIEGGEWVLGRLLGKHALLFRGADSGDRVELPEPKQFDFADAFSAAVWFKTSRFNTEYQSLLAKGDETWRLQRDLETNRLAFTVNSKADPEALFKIVGKESVADNRWHLVVVVYKPQGEKAEMRMYTDGRLDGACETLFPMVSDDSPVWISGNSRFPERSFLGHIDEVALFRRALSGEEIIAMFEAGSPYAAAETESASPEPSSHRQ